MIDWGQRKGMALLEHVRAALRTLTQAPWMFFGLAFYRAWLNLMLPDLGCPTVIPGVTGKALFDGTCALTALVVATVLLRFVAGHRSACATSAASCMAVAAIGLTGAKAASGLSLSWVITGVALLGAVGLMMLSLLWIEFYSSFNPIRMAAYYTFSLILGEVLSVLLLGYNALYLAIAAVILPAISAGCLMRSRLREFQAKEESREPVRPRSFPWKPAMFIGIYAFAYALPGVGLNEGLAYPDQLCSIIPAAVMLGSVLVNAKGFNFFKMYTLALPLMVCGLLLLALFASRLPGLANLCITTSYAAASLMIVLIVCGISFRTGASALCLFGIVRTVQYGAMFLGVVAGHGLEQEGSVTTVVSYSVPALVIGLVVIVSAVFVTERKHYFGWSVNASSSDGDGRDLADRIDWYGEECGLTQREREVLLLLVQGKTIASVAQDMFIAEGTVKAHVQHIYRKLDVHSREELIELVERRG